MVCSAGSSNLMQLPQKHLSFQVGRDHCLEYIVMSVKLVFHLRRFALAVTVEPLTIIAPLLSLCITKVSMITGNFIRCH